MFFVPKVFYTVENGRDGWGDGGRWGEGDGWAVGESGRGFLLHWGGAKTKGLFFVLARRCRPLADMSPARVGFNAPSSKNSRLIFAQQPRPNDKRKPLHHVLRTAGVGGGKGSGFGVQEKRSEVRRGQDIGDI